MRRARDPGGMPPHPAAPCFPCALLLAWWGTGAFFRMEAEARSGSSAQPASSSASEPQRGGRDEEWVPGGEEASEQSEQPAQQEDDEQEEGKSEAPPAPSAPLNAQESSLLEAVKALFQRRNRPFQVSMAAAAAGDDNLSACWACWTISAMSRRIPSHANTML